VMTNGRGDRTRETPRCHRGLKPRRDDWSLGLAIFIRASGHALAAHIGRIQDRSLDCSRHTVKALANRGPSIHDKLAVVSETTH
jgi:hypothetical protein